MNQNAKSFSQKEIGKAMQEYGPTGAGEGDSPYTNEFPDESNGIAKEGSE